MFGRAGEGGAEGCFGSSCAAEQIELTWGAEVRGAGSAGTRLCCCSTGGSAKHRGEWRMLEEE